jgi:DNA-binding GntR family transcriptional regulator
MSDALAPIDPVRRSTLGAMVTERLRELVIDGRFEPGTQLSEAELADRFGVSRGPIREALQHLLQEGLLRREPRRGISVPIVSDEDIADLYFAREAIEAAAMRVVLQMDVAALAAELRETVRLMGEAATRDDWTRVADLDMMFHSRLVAATASPRLTRIHAGIIDETRACFSMTARYPGREDLVAEHEELAALLERRDVPGVLKALEIHLSESIRTLAHYRPAKGRYAEPTARNGTERRS